MNKPVSEVRRHPVVQVLGRVGMVLYGVVYLLIAWLAVRVMSGGPAKPDSKGALAEIASSGSGPVLLWILAIGLFLFALWQAAEAVSGFTYAHSERSKWGKRLGAAVRAVTSVLIGIAAIKIVNGSRTEDSTAQQQEWTARLLSLPWGQWLVGAVAVGIAVVAVIAIRKGVKKTFGEDLDMSRLPDASRRPVEVVGRVGWIGKGLAYSVIAVLVFLAAITTDPSRSGGLDKALHTVAGQPFGLVGLIVLTLGIAAFGVYCVAAARAHRE